MKKRSSGFVFIVSKETSERLDNNQCPTCGKHKDDWKRRTDWRCCSADCTDKFERERIIRSWPELRLKAFKRDNYTCQLCGTQKVKRHKIGICPNGFNATEEYWCAYKEKISREEDIVIVGDDESLIGDHIIPISLGGDEWDIENIQTLCGDCNKIKTRKDMGDIAKARRKEKSLSHAKIF